MVKKKKEDEFLKMQLKECFWCGAQFDPAWHKFCPDCGNRGVEEGLESDFDY